jgi:hypothetical protein
MTPSGFNIGIIWSSQIVSKLISRSVFLGLNIAHKKPSIKNELGVSPGCYLEVIIITGF